MSRSSAAQPSFLNLPTGKSRLLSFLIVLLVLYAVIPQLKVFHSSLNIVQHSNGWWLIVALLFTFGTSLLASGLYLLLAKKKLQFRRTLMIQLASLFVNRLLPAGIGALGVNYEYLRKRAHSPAAAGVVVAINNLVGVLGHAALLSIVILTTSISLSQIARPHITILAYYIVLIVLVIGAVVLVWFKKLRSNIFRTVIGALKNIRSYRTHPFRLGGAFLLSMGLTSLYCLSLLASVHAVGVSLSFGQVFLVLTAGVVGGTIIPTPGGLGGAEAGLFTGLVAFKVSDPRALSIVLIYRFITYWLALAIGAVAWTYIRKRRYI